MQVSEHIESTVFNYLKIYSVFSISWGFGDTRFQPDCDEIWFIFSFNFQSFNIALWGLECNVFLLLLEPKCMLYEIHLLWIPYQVEDWASRIRVCLSGLMASLAIVMRFLIIHWSLHSAWTFGSYCGQTINTHGYESPEFAFLTCGTWESLPHV